MARRALFVSAFLVASPLAAQPASPDPAPPAGAVEDRPLSRAQTELFSTPHLSNVGEPATLEYNFTRTGPVPFQDRVAVNIIEVHPDGTKDVTFEFLTGDRQERHPPVGSTRGNPVLMMFLEHDVRTLRESLGIAATFWRNRLRDGLLERATVEDTTVSVDGRDVPARRIIVRPFQDLDRLTRIPSVRDKLYTFVLADAVPGGIVELRTDMAADPALGVPAAGESLTFSRKLAPSVPGASKP